MPCRADKPFEDRLQMIYVYIGIAVWLLCGVFAVALCRAAAKGDEQN
jgi:hypothetical protein